MTPPPRLPPPRVALGGIFVECNQFGGEPADRARFEQYELRRGSSVLQQDQGAVGGMLDVLRGRAACVLPLLVTSTCSAGPVTTECYRELKRELLDDLRRALPIDGVLLALHGSGVVEGLGDLEGDLLRSVREVVGDRVPVVATLDLHAHVTPAMVENADALIAWETYPHKDAYTTGQRGAKMLLGILDGKFRPAMVMAKVPVLTSGCLGHTEGDGPFADLMRFAKSHEGRDGVLSAGVFLVHPYLDLPDLGSGGLVITDGDMEQAARLAEEIARRYWDRRHDLEPQLHTPAEAIRLGLELDGGPVLLVETADCAGGGAAGDSVATLKALLECAGAEPSLAVVVDPSAAAMCHAAGLGADVSLELGHHLDPQWGQPIHVTGRVESLGDGRFQYSGGIWEQTWASMGPSAVLRVGSVRVLIMSQATYDWADEQFRSMGLDPRQAKFVVVKNPMNYRFSYAGLARASFVLDTPGPTPATLRHVQYRQMKRPYFPADAEIPGLKPTLLRGRLATCGPPS